MIINEVTVHFQRKIDTGYHPYMAYLETLGGRGPAFGTRDNSNAELGMFVKGTVEEGEDAEIVAAGLIDLARNIIDVKMGQMFPAAFGPDQAAFQTDSVEVQYAVPMGEF